MAHVNIPQDLEKIKSKFALGLTLKQLGLIALGALVGMPVLFIVRSFAGNAPAIFSLFMCIMPFAFLALYEKDGLTAWQWVNLMVRFKLRPPNRLYISLNYDALRKSARKTINRQKRG